MSDTVIRVENLSKRYRIGGNRQNSADYGSLRESLVEAAVLPFRKLWNLASGDTLPQLSEIWALKSLTFEVNKGEGYGIVGRNGAGKSTLLKILARITKPTSGRAVVRGRMGSLLEVGTGFHQELTGRENIYLNGAIIGMKKREIDQRFDEIVSFSEIGNYLDTPVKFYSSGMYVRLAFSIAAHFNPEILLVDEVLAVGDIGFQYKCIKHMSKYIQSGGTIILISHNMHLIQSICKTGILLDKGVVEAEGLVTYVINRYFENQIELNSPKITENQSGNDKELPLILQKIEVIPIKNDEIYTGDSISLKLTYISKEYYPRITWGFSIWNKDQSVRITTNTAKYCGIQHELKKGKGTLSCNIPKLPLVTGTYAIRAGVYDLETSWPLARLGWETPATYFTVRASADEINNRRVVDGDLITFDVVWDT